MKYVFTTLLLSAVLLLTACVTTNNAPEKKYYTNTEYSKMTYCIGISDTAMYAASAKLKGTPKQQLLDYYANKPSEQLQSATVNKVYAANFTNAWDYTVSFFDECALNLAGVTKQRVNFASFCSQNALIANAAYLHKQSGRTKEYSLQHFSIFKSKTPLEIVERVYASSRNRSEVKLDEWNRCMEKISD